MSSNTSTNSSAFVPTHSTEGLIVIMCGFICTIGNFSCVILIVFHKRFRKTTVVILCHHCFLDFLKSLYCFPYGYSLMTSYPAPHCTLIGSSYVLIMTTSAYNMIALVVNQDYDIMFTEYRQDDCYCVIFGIFIIWFISLLLNLGIALIPSNTQYNHDIGSCLFLYGCNYSYILHVLWILLVTIAVSMSLLFFCRMKKNLLIDNKRFQWRTIHESLTEEFEKMLDFNIRDGDHDSIINSQKHAIQTQLRTTRILMSIVISFIIFWYPLFILTIFDFRFKVTPSVYRILTVLAWCHPITTPIFCSLVLRDIKFKGYTLRDISSNLMPLRRITSHHHYRNANAFDFDCKSHLDTEVDDIQLQSNADKDDMCIGFANQRYAEGSPSKVTSTV